MDQYCPTIVLPFDSSYDMNSALIHCKVAVDASLSCMVKFGSSDVFQYDPSDNFQYLYVYIDTGIWGSGTPTQYVSPGIRAVLICAI